MYGSLMATKAKCAGKNNMAHVASEPFAIVLWVPMLSERLLINIWRITIFAFVQWNVVTMLDPLMSNQVLLMHVCFVAIFTVELLLLQNAIKITRVTIFYHQANVINILMNVFEYVGTENPCRWCAIIQIYSKLADNNVWVPRNDCCMRYSLMQIFDNGEL